MRNRYLRLLVIAALAVAMVIPAPAFGDVNTESNTEGASAGTTVSSDEGNTSATGGAETGSSEDNQVTPPDDGEDNPPAPVGWVTDNGKTYYYYEDGTKATGIVTINGRKYCFDRNGVRLTDAKAVMDIKADGLSSKTRYLCLVNLKTHYVGVYKGSKGNWTRVKYMRCSDGKKGHRTPKGTFSTGKYKYWKYKVKYFDSHGVRCWYATRITGHYLFHSVTYKRSLTPKRVADGKLGKCVSNGCIRLAVKDAKWIYNTIPSGTKTVIYSN